MIISNLPKSFWKLSCYFLLAAILSACVFEPEEQRAPNVIMVIVDDLGWNDLAYAGSTFYETPHIDAFKEECVHFTNAYSAGSVCSPTRASIMTGMHPSRLNITDWIPGRNPPNTPLLGPEDLDALELKEETIAEILKSNGYKTFFAGKWHLGSEGYHPEEQGFEINLGGHDKGSPPGGYYVPYKNPKLTDGPEGEYLPDRLTDETISYIENAGEEPFFACLSYYTVHTPIQASQKHIKYFENKAASLGNPKTETKMDGAGITRLNQNDPAYASMVYAMDENIGKLIKSLKESGLYDNTMIIFTSDNGGLSTLQTDFERPGPTAVLPLRGGKGWLTEGGIKIPLLIKTPQSNLKQAKVVDTPTASYDLMPTILEEANISSSIQFDGIDLSPVWEEQSIDRTYLYWDYPHYHGSGWKPGAAIRKGQWKLIKYYENDVVELYDLEQDIGESTNIASRHPEVVQQLVKLMESESQKLNAQKVSINPDYVKN